MEVAWKGCGGISMDRGGTIQSKAGIKNVGRKPLDTFDFNGLEQCISILQLYAQSDLCAHNTRTTCTCSFWKNL